MKLYTVWNNEFLCDSLFINVTSKGLVIDRETFNRLWLILSDFMHNLKERDVNYQGISYYQTYDYVLRLLANELNHNSLQLIGELKQILEIQISGKVWDETTFNESNEQMSDDFINNKVYHRDDLGELQRKKRAYSDKFYGLHRLYDAIELMLINYTSYDYVSKKAHITPRKYTIDWTNVNTNFGQFLSDNPKVFPNKNIEPFLEWDDTNQILSTVDNPYYFCYIIKT